MLSKVAVGKIGTTISFSKKRQINSKSAIYEVTNTLIYLAKKYPKTTFYIISRSDYDRLTDEEKQEFFPNNNVVNIIKKDFTFDNIPKCDAEAAIVFAGPSTGVNRTNYFKKHDSDELATTLNAFDKYSAPAYWVINENKIPWIYLGLDPRYIQKNIMNCSDMFVNPSYVGVLYTPDVSELHCQFDKLLNQDGSYRTIDYKVPIKNCYQYVLNLDRNQKNIGNHDKYMLSMHNDNSGNSTPHITDRFALNRKYFYNNEYWNDKVDIAGDWEKSMNKIPDDKKKLYIGGIKPNELYQFIGQYRYTVLYSMYYGMSSGKWFEMLAAGVIPFLIEDYDKSCDYLPKDHFLRINNSDELVTKVKALDNKSKEDIAQMTNKLLNDTLNRLEDKFISFLDEAMVKCIKDKEKWDLNI